MHQFIMVLLMMLNMVSGKRWLWQTTTLQILIVWSHHGVSRTQKMGPRPRSPTPKNFRALNASTRASSQFCLIFPFESSAEARRGMRMKASGVSSTTTIS